MPTLIIAMLAVAIAELGDKSQLLVLVLAARFRRPAAVVAGILVAALLMHSIAAWIGDRVADLLDPQWVRWLLVAAFLAVAAWSLLPERDERKLPESTGRSAFLTTAIAFFVFELGDKTQIATMVLAARYEPLWQVALGSTLGIVLVNAPVVLLGDRLPRKFATKYLRWAAAAIFAAMAAWVAWHGVGG